MSAGLRKEARALLPYWAGTLALVLAPIAVGKDGADLAWFFYCLGCALLGSVSFGHEMQHRTLAMLLTQPISRAVIWRDKMIVLAAALASTTAVFVGISRAIGGPHVFDAVVSIGDKNPQLLPLVPLSVSCGAPLLTLLADRALGGAVLSLVVPGACLTFASAAHLAFPSVNEAAVSSTLLIVYCPLAVALGYVRFRTLEVRSRRPLEIASWLLPARAPARSGPLRALVQKELRLQYGTFVLALPIWGLFLLGGLLSHAGKGDWRVVAAVVTAIDALVLPLVVGAVALGEERTLGVADWQLTLPPSARLQWLAKMLVMLPTSLFLGLVVPLCLWRPVPGGGGWLVLGVAYLLLMHLGIYAGSVSRGTMPAFLVAVGLWCALGVAVLYGSLLERLGGGVSSVIALAVMLLLLHIFAFANYRRRDLGPRRLLLQGLTLSGVLVLFVVIA